MQHCLFPSPALRLPPPYGDWKPEKEPSTPTQLRYDLMAETNGWSVCAGTQEKTDRFAGPEFPIFLFTLTSHDMFTPLRFHSRIPKRGEMQFWNLCFPQTYMTGIICHVSFFSRLTCFQDKPRKCICLTMCLAFTCAQIVFFLWGLDTGEQTIATQVGPDGCGERFGTSQPWNRNTA